MVYRKKPVEEGTWTVMGHVDRQLTCSAFCSFLSRICVNVPASNSSTLWLMPTETSMNFARYVQAKHFPSGRE